MIYCDTNNSVLEWGSEEIIIPYLSPMDGKVHRYFPDFYIKIRQRNGSIKKMIIEIKPKKIYFGEKDMQKLKIINHFIKKNHKSIMVIGCKTIREKNGIACSSRNFFLTLKQKKIASKIYKFLKSVKNNLIRNQLLIKRSQMW